LGSIGLDKGILLGAFSNGGHRGAKSAHEPSIERSKSMETVHLMNIIAGRPIHNSTNLPRISGDFLRGYNESEEDDIVLCKRTFQQRNFQNGGFEAPGEGGHHDRLNSC
jgi:hypothetical protein